MRLDQREKVPEFRWLDQSPLHHRPDIDEVAIVASLQLRKRLAIRIVVKKVDGAVPRNEEAALSPAGDLRDEVPGAGELDVDVEFILEDASASKNPAGSGLAFKSMSMVESRQPCRTAVTPSVR